MKYQDRIMEAINYINDDYIVSTYDFLSISPACELAKGSATDSQPDDLCK